MTAPTANVDIAEMMQRHHNSPFWAVRGHAINAYASVEQALCGLLATFGDMPDDVAALIFFKMVNTRSRMAVLDKLLTKKFQNTYALYWNSINKFIKLLDQERNNIVHWHVANNIKATGDGGVVTSLTLVPGNIHEATTESPFIDEAGMIEFIYKARFAAGSCSALRFFLADDRFRASEAGQTWREIFQQALIYPPPNNHPLARTS